MIDCDYCEVGPFVEDVEAVIFWVVERGGERTLVPLCYDCSLRHPDPAMRQKTKNYVSLEEGMGEYITHRVLKE